MKLPPSFRWHSIPVSTGLFSSSTLEMMLWNSSRSWIDISCNNITHDGSTGITFTYICDLKLMSFFVGKIYRSHGSVMGYSSIFLKSLLVGFHGFLFKPGVYGFTLGTHPPKPRNIHHMSPGQGQGKFFLPWRWMDQLQRTALTFWNYRQNLPENHHIHLHQVWFSQNGKMIQWPPLTFPLAKKTSMFLVAVQFGVTTKTTLDF